MKLSKAGYGSLNEVMEMDARKIIQLINYEQYCSDYESAWMELNRDHS